MNSVITELYQVAQEYVSDAYTNPADYTIQQVDNALTVIELIEDGKHEEAVKIGLVY